MAFVHRKIKPYVTIMHSGRLVEDMGMEILNVSTSKRLDATPGTFTMTLVPRRVLGQPHGTSTSTVDAYRRFEPGDVVSIGFEKPHGAMLGRITDLKKGRQTIGTTLTRTLTISGKEIGGELLEDSYRNIPSKRGSAALSFAGALGEKLSEVAQSAGAQLDPRNALQFLDLQELNDMASLLPGRVTGMQAAAFINFALTWLPSLRVDLDVLGTKTTVGRIIRTQRDVPLFAPDRVLLPRPSTLQGNSFVNMLRNALDKDFYEIFWDTFVDSNDMPYIKLIVRPKPFDREGDVLLEPHTGVPVPVTAATPRSISPLRWEELTTEAQTTDGRHTITEDQLFAIDLGVSSSDVHTAYTVRAAQSGLNNAPDVETGSGHPLVDFGLMRRFGYRELMVRSQQVEDRADQSDAESGGIFSNAKEALGVVREMSGVGLGAAEEAIAKAEEKLLELRAQAMEVYQKGKEKVDQARAKVLEAIGSSADTLTQSKQRRLYNWYRHNLHFESGTVTFLGREAVRIGERVFLADEAAKDGTRGLEGYITGVHHSWGYGGKFETRIDVERCISEETRRGAEALFTVVGR
jgi:hypothetical protein